MNPQSTSSSPDESYSHAVQHPPVDHKEFEQPLRPAFSKQAISGFIVACISMLVFGFMSIVGVYFCVRALREVRSGAARGRGLAIAGITVGSLSFVLYVANMFIRA
ncbi:DUF4190 domain-containing protein [Arthrobacter sp. HLT1-20]